MVVRSVKPKQSFGDVDRGLLKLSRSRFHMKVQEKIMEILAHEFPLVATHFVLAGVKATPPVGVTIENLLDLGVMYVDWFVESSHRTDFDVLAALLHRYPNQISVHFADPYQMEYERLECKGKCPFHLAIDEGGKYLTAMSKGKATPVDTVIVHTTRGLYEPSKCSERQMNIPIFMVCKSSIKLLLDCFYGCGVGFSKNWEETTDSPLSGREVTVVGAGEVGKGILVQAKAQGARVWSSEINPKRQLEAITTCGSHGILLRKAIRKNGMIIVLATGSNKYTLGKPALSNEILAKIPKGVGIWIVIMGSGQEVDLYGLCSLSTQIFSEASGSEISTDDVLKSRLNGVTRFELTSGGTVYLVGSGCGALNNDHGGHTTSTMDPVLAYWLMVPIYALQEKEKIKSGVQMVPEEVEQSLSLLVLNVLSVPCERRTLRQAKHYGIYFWDWFEEMKRKHER